MLKVKYIGDNATAKTVSGKDVKLEKGMELECMEKEYYSALFVRTLLPSGEHVKIKRGELQKVQ